MIGHTSSQRHGRHTFDISDDQAANVLIMLRNKMMNLTNDHRLQVVRTVSRFKNSHIDRVAPNSPTIREEPLEWQQQIHVIFR